MRHSILSTVLLLTIDACSCQGFGQARFLAVPGEINHIEGTAFLNGSRLAVREPAPVIASGGARLETAIGRVEVLLSPGSFLRVGDYSEVTFDALGPSGVTIAVKKGEVLLEVLTRFGYSPTVILPKTLVHEFAAGIYEAHASGSQFQVFEGSARLEARGQASARLETGPAAIYENAGLLINSFDRNEVDALYVWSAHAAEYEAAANYGIVASAAIGSRKTGWYWNPQMRCWAFVPEAGTIAGRFGWLFLAGPEQLRGALILNGPVFHFPAVANPVNLPRIFPAPPNAGVVDVAHTPRLERPDKTVPVDLGPGAPSILR